jgi:MarR family transcriptional regulator for hemolysin
MVKPPKFPPLETLGKSLALAMKAVRALLDARLAAHGTNFATWITLNALAPHGSLIQRDIASALGASGPTLVQKLHAMEADGLVTRSGDPTDRRTTRVELTPKGVALYRAVRADVEQLDAQLAGVLTPTEQTALRRSLLRLTERARELRGGDPPRAVKPNRRGKN